MNIQKRIAADILKCGESRVWMDSDAHDKIRQAITRRDVRGLIKDGLIKKRRGKKSLRAGPRRIMLQAAKGRRSGLGSRKGAVGGRSEKKEKWLKIVRPQRKLLRSLRKEGKLQKAGAGTAGSDYGTLYKQIKGNMFRSKHHLISHLEERGLANISLSEFEKAEKSRKEEMKKQKKVLFKKAAEKEGLMAKKGEAQKSNGGKSESREIGKK